ncbi:Permease of the drug/metabolite transporter (DMT) superfamily [Amycolatopsis arida]|uniref:Permease of the drug/metabolite transporter (DMT) superfamily n=1 Tax=Amycolatopsis arida TaxID=587909 RepID=A0A1I5PR24_9PSEU|nr:DMT family transporter [Amycolatopsis arida]TDX98580.1 drug/metabolite transporter (DMT)-like permease [Amycolatopsis arida]SFP36592.1 Permease of the drug/metabolite transporter (DMT) superfamily [Amycolatopsis arida]
MGAGGGSVPVTGLLGGYPVIAGQALRYALGGLLLLAWARLRGRPLPPPRLVDLPALVAPAAAGMIGFQACLLHAQRHAEPGLIAAVLGVSPLVLAVAGPLAARRRPAAAPVLGAALAVGGVAVISGGGAGSGTGLALAVLAMLCEASFTLFAVGLVARIGPLATATWSCLTAAVGGALVAALTGGAAVWRLPEGRELAAIVVLGVLVTAVAFVGWYFAVGVLGADRAGLLIGVMPVAGLAVAVLLGAQALAALDVVGALLVGAGVALGLRAKRHEGHLHGRQRNEGGLHGTRVSDRRGPSAARPVPRRAAPR